jgi:hypothetical protein
LKRQGKPPKYFESRFKEYHYYDIYRSTQDADIVIDVPGGDLEEHEKIAQELERVMAEKYGHLQGSKSVWEVRFLRVDRGVKGEPSYKDALLGWEFQNQNTDSYSTGLIELTQPPRGESVVRDVKAWEGNENIFLKDLAEGKIRFYLEPEHAKTLRFFKGMNPEIVSAIRFYVKAFQYDATIPEEEEAKVLTLIERFDPKKAPIDSYAAKQIRNTGLKLYWHAIDVERAARELDRVGLRSKLITYGSRLPTQGAASESLAIWLARKPLPSLPVGEGPKIEKDAFPGYRPSLKTARELGIVEVAHETDQLLAYENILRGTMGFPNVFESISIQHGQAAVHGDGWYTKIGSEGATGSGFTIRSRVSPDAIEGIDFFIQEKEGFVVFRNRNALSVIDESLSMTALEYVRMLLSEAPAVQSDRGILETLTRRVNARLGQVHESERLAIRDLVLSRIDRFDERFIRKWFALPVSRLVPELADELIERKGAGSFSGIFGVLSAPFPNHPTWLGSASGKIRNHPSFKPWFDAVLSEREIDLRVVEWTLFEPGFETDPRVSEWMDRLITRRVTLTDSSLERFMTPEWRALPEWGKWLKSLITHQSRLFHDIFGRVTSAPSGEWDEAFWIAFHSVNWRVIDSFFTASFQPLQQKVNVTTLIEKRPDLADRLFESISKMPESSQDVLLRNLTNNIEALKAEEIVYGILENRVFKNNSSLRERLFGRLSVLTLWADRPGLSERLIAMGWAGDWYIEKFLKEPTWAKHSELFLRFAASASRHKVSTLLNLPHWRNSTELRRICGDEVPTYACIRSHIFARREKEGAWSYCIRLLKSAIEEISPI